MPPVFCSGLAQPMHSKCIASTEMVSTNNSMDPVESVFAGTHDVMWYVVVVTPPTPRPS